MPIMGKADPDQLRGEAALYLWNHYRPDLLMVHFVWYDSQAHAFGPASPEALTALESADQAIGKIRDAISSDPATTLVVLSDHGFVPVEREVAPLVVFAEHGLFTRGADGSVSLRRLGAVSAGGSLAIYWLEEPSADDRRRLATALDRLRDTGSVAEIVDRRKLEALQADPDAELMIEAAPGLRFLRAAGRAGAERFIKGSRHPRILPLPPGNGSDVHGGGTGNRSGKEPRAHFVEADRSHPGASDGVAGRYIGARGKADNPYINPRHTRIEVSNGDYLRLGATFSGKIFLEPGARMN